MEAVRTSSGGPWSSAIQGAVAAGVVESYQSGTGKFGARRFNRIEPDPANVAVYRALSENEMIRDAMHELGSLGAALAIGHQAPVTTH